MEKLALIYVGGNTTRYALWQIEEDKSYRLLESFKENLKLGRNTQEEFVISDEKTDELVKILSYFKEFSDSINATNTFVILSEFFDRIENKKEIRNRLETQLEMDVIELSSEEELKLDYLALVNSMRLTSSLVVDISGGSTQLAYIKDGELIESHLLPLGTLSLTEMFSLEQLISQENHMNLESFLRSELAKVSWLTQYDYDDMVIVGGSARAISKIDRKKRRYPINIIHEYTMQDLDISSLYTNLMTKTLKQRYAIEGLDKERADILPSALAILNSILGKTGIRTLRVSGAGIREGFLFNYLTEHHGELGDMLDRSINNILSRHNVDKERAENLYRMTMEIYQGMNGIHKDWQDLDEIMKVSAKLRDVGMSIRYYNHDRHNFYIISNSEINGIDHRKIIMSALAAAFSNGLAKETPLLQYGQLINRMDLSMVYDIGICLSIAEKLLRSDKKAIFLKDTTVDETTVTFHLISSEELHFEVHAVMKLKDIFCELYGKKLNILYELQD